MIDAHLYRLMSWLSPAYPLGSFSYSHGIEYAVEAGRIRGADELLAWVTVAVEKGAGLSDAALLAASWRSAAEKDALDTVVELARAWRGSAETALESEAQGAAFLATTRLAWPHEGLDALHDRHQGKVALPVAVGVSAALQGIPLEASLTAYLHSFAGTLVSAGIRLVPLGQSAGQKIIAALEPVVARTRGAAMATPIEEIGTASLALDIASMRHETQYTRLFRS
ncbi:MAG TPA: urease accessory protein UreF [Stellaceae bacterium]|nr:urease accessory protein UreF [Stellaceae bacterium]